MSDFTVTILGCGSAKPTLAHYTSSQIVQHRGNLFLVDCGEGVQRSMLRSKISMNKIGHIFLSHLHGDHCLGLVGLISTLGLGQRTGEIVIHAQPDAERVFRPLFDFFCPDLSMTVTFQPYDPQVSEVIYEDRSLLIRTIPLHHRVPTAGFLFQEKPRERHLLVDRCEEVGIPFAYYPGLKRGNDWTDPDSGRVIPNELLTSDPTPSKSYAFCSDTMYAESVVPLVRGCDLLYHEATYGDADAVKARQRGHSTAREAATIALKAEARRLVIGHYSAQFVTSQQEQALLAEAQSVFPNTVLSHEQLVLDV